MILETNRLILRGWRDEDAPSLFKYAKDERVGPVAGWPAHKDEAYSRAVIRTVFAKEEVYAICLKSMDDEAIGSIGLTLEGSKERPLESWSAELGFWVGVPFWGRGIVTEAAKEILRHAFEDLCLDRVYCAYFEGNERSRKVQEKCGFTYHHTNRQTRLLSFDETRTEHVNVLTYEQWRGEI